MKRDFFRFIVGVSVFLTLFVLMDMVAGYSFHKLVHGLPKTESTIARVNYSINKADADCIVLGSSRAADQYVSNILADSLGVSVYNAGKQGYGALYAYAVLQQIVHRHIPKCVILEMDDYELCSGQEPMKELYPYRDNPEIAAILREELDRMDFWLTELSVVRYNCVFLNILSAYTKPLDKEEGYVNVGDVSKVSVRQAGEDLTICETTQKYINRIIQICIQHGIRLRIISSPRCQIIHNKVIPQLIHTINDDRVLYFDYSQDSVFQNDASLFYDYLHLNHRGAQIYSSKVAHDLRENW